MVVSKPGRKIRLHGDYKVNTSPQLHINQYLLPKPGQLFHMLNGGQKFSKMDLSYAYIQVELEEDSVNCITINNRTTINNHRWHFQYTRVSFGVAWKNLAVIDGAVIYLDYSMVNDMEHL